MRFRFLISHFSFLISKIGQAALSFVFLIGGIVILIGVTFAFLVANFINSTYGSEYSNKAYTAATAGAEDALMQLLRNKDFSSTSYTVPVNSISATVSVTQNSPAANQATIVSSATVSFHERKIQVIADVASSTGEVTVSSWQLLTL